MLIDLNFELIKNLVVIGEKLSNCGFKNHIKMARKGPS